MKSLALISAAFVLAILVRPHVPSLYVSGVVGHLSEAKVLQNVVPTPTPDVDKLVDKSSKKYGKTRYQANRIKVALHFLLLKEQNYGGSDSCGDSGLACGPLQFHEATYEGYRAIMLKRGLVTTEGSRLDMADAIETAAWAIADGRETAWGPIARREISL